MEIGTLKTNGVHLADHEYDTVKLLTEKGYDIELIPPSAIKGLRMPDIMINSVPWEIKSPTGNGKHTIKHNLQNATHQSNNVIIDLRRCKLPEDQALSEIQRRFDLSKRIRNMKVITADEKIIDLNKS